MVHACWPYSATPFVLTASCLSPELAKLDNVTITRFLVPFQGNAKPHGDLVRA